MSGSRVPHLQRRNGIYHLRVRVPDRLRARIERLEVCRSLHTYSSAVARRLAAQVSAQVQGTFAMIEQNTAISPQQARHLVQGCFEDLRDRIDGAGPMVPITDRGDLEMLEQRALAGDAINSLQRQLDGFNFAHATELAADDLLTRRGVHLAQVSKETRALLLSGVTRALIEQQRHFITRLNDPLAAHQPHDPLFEQIQVSPLVSPPAVPAVQPFGPSTADAVQTYLSAKARRQCVDKASGCPA